MARLDHVTVLKQADYKQYIMLEKSDLPSPSDSLKAGEFQAAAAASLLPHLFFPPPSLSPLPPLPLLCFSPH